MLLETLANSIFLQMLLELSASKHFRVSRKWTMHLEGM